jgi:hypothetical protein
MTCGFQFPDWSGNSKEVDKLKICVETSLSGVFPHLLCASYGILMAALNWIS